MRELKIGAGDENQRLDKFLKKYLNKAPASFIYRMLRKKNIKLNKEKATGSEILKENDHVELYLADATIDEFRDIKTLQKQPLPKVVYEDAHLIFLNKPSGLLTQKAKETDSSLVDQLLYYLYKEGKYDPDAGGSRPSVCNRLDRNTSGLVLCGVDLPGLQFLSEALKERTLTKEYLCVVRGNMQKAHVKGYLYKNEKNNRVSLYEHPVEGASYAETIFTPLSTNFELSLVKAELITGKTHQIRSHLAFVGHPIIGDTKYGNPVVNRKYRLKYGVEDQLLHAAYVSFPEITGRFSYLSGKRFAAELPEIFSAVMKGEDLHE